MRPRTRTRLRVTSEPAAPAAWRAKARRRSLHRLVRRGALPPTTPPRRPVPLVEFARQRVMGDTSMDALMSTQAGNLLGTGRFAVADS